MKKTFNKKLNALTVSFIFTVTSFNISNIFGKNIEFKANTSDEIPVKEEKIKVDERWNIASAGTGSGGKIIVQDNGSIVFDAIDNRGKIADSEDGFLYYYTEINPKDENFTLSASFRVDDDVRKDNQSGFGIIAIDTFMPGKGNARYFNSAGTMVAKYTGKGTKFGIPGGRFVTGYVSNPTVSSASRDLSMSKPFDWNFKDDYVVEGNNNPPKFQAGETYKLTLRKSNTGFHAILNNDTENEIICYEPNLLLQQDKEKYYVGIAVARKIKVTVEDIKFETINPKDDEEVLSRPIEYIEPKISFDSTSKTSSNEYNLVLKSNVKGTATIINDKTDNIIEENIPIEDDIITIKDIILENGINKIKVIFNPYEKDKQNLKEYQELTSYDNFEKTHKVEVRKIRENEDKIYVSNSGNESGDGSLENPLDIHTAVSYVSPGQTIVLDEGTYKPTKQILIDRGVNGTAKKPIKLMAEDGKEVIFDISQSKDGGIILRGDYWHIYNIDVRKGRQPVAVKGNNNILEKVRTHHNLDTGLQISGDSKEPFSMWPANNLILSCESYDNKDTTAQDADGFGAKLCVGEGNIFRYCIAHNNIDDGFDLYAKSTSGSIGSVRLENCVAYRNGFLSDDEDRILTSDGNGFKLGGESMPAKHVLVNSVAFDNYRKGITSNSCPDVIVENCTSYGNGTSNIQLSTNAKTTNFKVKGLISLNGKDKDSISFKNQEDTITKDPTNFFNGKGVDNSWFENLNININPEILEDGTIDMKGLLVLTENAPKNSGARIK